MALTNGNETRPSTAEPAGAADNLAVLDVSDMIHQDSSELDDSDVEVQIPRHMQRNEYRRRQRVGAVAGIMLLVVVCCGAGAAIYLSQHSSATVRVPKVRTDAQNVVLAQQPVSDKRLTRAHLLLCWLDTGVLWCLHDQGPLQRRAGVCWAAPQVHRCGRPGGVGS